MPCRTGLLSLLVEVDTFNDEYGWNMECWGEIFDILYETENEFYKVLTAEEAAEDKHWTEYE